jgi:hypothetical protein
MGKTILFVDYENIQNINLAVINRKDTQIKIFVGQAQTKIPFDLVQTAQKFGNSLEWIKIEGTGKDSLDFHIAFYLGKITKYKKNTLFIILSKDKGFDPLIQHICKQNIPCRRIESLSELLKDNEKIIFYDENSLAKIIEKLVKTDNNKRPRSKQALRNYIKFLFLPKKLSEEEIDTLVNILFSKNKISKVNSYLVYDLEIN